MDQPADFSLLDASDGPWAKLTGDWTSRAMNDADKRLDQAMVTHADTRVDLTAIGRCDTVGAMAILRAGQGRLKPGETLKGRAETLRLIELISRVPKERPPPPAAPLTFMVMMERLGRGLVGVGLDVYDTMAFNGRVLAAAGRLIVDPRRMRWAPLISLAERAGLDAMPIVAVTSFFIGAVIGFLGAHMLAQFGAQVFTVELIGVGVLREFAIVITAVLLAGRSASSFAAEVGSMKMNQEIDAMLVLGVDPYEALVLPRFMALLFTIPLLTFVAVLAGLAGGLMVTWGVLGLSPDFFLARMLDNVGISHFWVGLSKAPVMALVIAGIGCRQGMEVAGDVESLGRRVTAAVVHAIFSIIFIDAVFALIYMELDI
ncbi:MAG TPA: ABC transporter permease [Caulobacteraceae bacterium]|nr:ABC transporter permease [Caulobacteraceae bacterium]